MDPIETAVSLSQSGIENVATETEPQPISIQNDADIPTISSDNANSVNYDTFAPTPTETSKTTLIAKDIKQVDVVAVGTQQNQDEPAENLKNTSTMTSEKSREVSEEKNHTTDESNPDDVAVALEGLILADLKIDPESEFLYRQQNSDDAVLIIKHETSVPEKENHVSQAPLDGKENLVDDLKIDQNEKLVQITILKDEQTSNNAIKKHEKWFDIHPLLEEYDQCFFNWIPDDNPLTLEEADIILQVFTSKYENITGPLVDKFLKWCPVEIIAQHLIIAFIHLLQSKLIEAMTDLNKVAEMIKHAGKAMFISIDYLEGFVYLFTGLEALKKSLLINSAVPENEAEEALKDLESFVAKSTKFKELPKLAQVLVKGARVMFVGSRRLNQEERDMIKDVIIEDPDSVEWLTNLIGVSKICRRETDYRAGPSEEEKLTLLRAIELDEKHVLVKLYICMYLSEIIKSRTWDPQSGSLTLGNFAEFASIKEVVDFIKIKANEIIRVMDCCGKINLGIAEIFGFMLPFEHRDAQLAKKCLSYALIYNPKSSKANHKMGLLALTVEKQPDEARKYIKEALACEPRNFSALIDVVHILLQNPKDNAEELNKLFVEQIKPQQWSPKRLAGLQFTQGVHHYMLGEKDAAVKTWITMYQMDPESPSSFKQLSYCSNRYLWNRRDVSITNVYDHFVKIVSSKGSCLNPAPNLQEFDIIVKLYETVESSKSEDDIRFGNRSQYRGGMRGGGSYTHGNKFNNREQGSSYQDRGRGTFRGRGRGRGRGSSASNSGQWKGHDEGSLQQKTTDEYRGETSHGDNNRKKPFVKKSENGTNKMRDPTNPSSEGGRGFHSKRGRGNNRGGRGKGDGARGSFK